MFSELSRVAATTPDLKILFLLAQGHTYNNACMVGWPQAVDCAVFLPVTNNLSMYSPKEIWTLGTGQWGSYPDVVYPLVQPGHHVHQQVGLAAGITGIRNTVAYRPDIGVTISDHNRIGCQAKPKDVERGGLHAIYQWPITRVRIQVTHYHQYFVTESPGHAIKNLRQLTGHK